MFQVTLWCIKKRPVEIDLYSNNFNAHHYSKLTRIPPLPSLVVVLICKIKLFAVSSAG